MTNTRWIFFDIGSTLIDESECYKLRYREAVEGTTIRLDDFEKKVVEFSKKNLKGDHGAGGLLEYFEIVSASAEEGISKTDRWRGMGRVIGEGARPRYEKWENELLTKSSVCSKINTSG